MWSAPFISLPWDALTIVDFSIITSIYFVIELKATGLEFITKDYLPLYIGNFFTLYVWTFLQGSCNWLCLYDYLVPVELCFPKHSFVNGLIGKCIFSYILWRSFWRRIFWNPWIENPNAVNARVLRLLYVWEWIILIDSQVIHHVIFSL